ncbi:MAG TPA: hypothetical protein VN660_02145 [Steroidobacteraceae bacterium]|nr:hypothetical protein [Steroidobacteraceae bacterium]
MIRLDLERQRQLASPVGRGTAREVIKTYGAWIQGVTTAETVARAAELCEVARICFWDALIVASAEEVAAEQILSEELNGGQLIVGIRIVNPFKIGVMEP